MRIFPLLLLLAACDAVLPPEPEPQAKAPPPPGELCSQAREGLATLKSKGALDHDEEGTATIPQNAWLGMGPGAHNQLAQMLAYHAACARPDGSAERRVVIRNEFGVVLLENVVPTTIDLESMGEE